jgi:transcriptional regulator with XRE-family HTH domain
MGDERQRFVSERGRRGLTQAQAAELAGIGQSSVSAYERGRHVRPDTERAILDQLARWTIQQALPAPVPPKPVDADAAYIEKLWRAKQKKIKGIDF